MSTIKVSNARELNSALDDARSGDRISLSQGDYHALDVNGRYNSNLKGVTIASADDNRPAVFDEMDLRNVSGITLDGLKFDDDGGARGRAFSVYNSSGITIRNADFEGVVKNGYGATYGLQVLKSDDITVERSEFSDFFKAATFVDINDLTVRDNDFYRSSIDSMVFGDVHDARIEGNEVHGQKINGKHTDMIQFWAVTKDGVSTDVTIKGNILKSGGDGETHGIFIGNEIFAKTGSRGDFYKNIVIEDNTIVSGQYHGLSVGATDGLTIRDNVVLQDPGAPNKGVTIPRIVVADAATDVKITGNTAHMISDDGGASWKVGGNKIVPLGTKTGKGGSDKEDKSDDAKISGSRDADTKDAGGGSKDKAATSHGDGDADTFSFKGTEVKGTDHDKVAGLDFGEGDELVLRRYDRDTFDDHWRDSNYVANNKEGTFVRIDSLADIREIADASTDVGVKVRGDTLEMTIHQDDGTQILALEGLGQTYDALF